MSWLLDTNILSETRKKNPDLKVVSWLQAQSLESCFLSVVSLGEIEQGIARLQDPIHAFHLREWLENTIEVQFAGRFLSIELKTIRAWGRLSGESLRHGKALSVMDGLIAATSIVHSMTLVTRNIKDFAHLPVTLLNPWEISSNS